MLVEAINSVRNQTQQNFEIIIIDDCSTDGTEDLVKTFNDPRIRYFLNDKNSGLERNRNTGFRHARGKYITFLDDDDYYTDYNFFTNAVKIFENHANDDIPLAFVCANAESLDLRTGKSKPSNIGQPGRVKGIDYILNRERKYNKPLSTFPTLFDANIMRRAGLEDMIIFDTATYFQAALLGDAWFMQDIIGVYRVHGESYTLGYAKKDPEREAIQYATIREDARRWRMIREKLYDRADKRVIDRWFSSGIVMLINYFSTARPSLNDKIKITWYNLRESGFMPLLWLKIAKNFVFRALRKITPLRKLYRAIKYHGRDPD